MIQAEGTGGPTGTEGTATDPWIRVLTATKEDDTGEDHSVKLVGSTFKVDVAVERVKI